MPQIHAFIFRKLRDSKDIPGDSGGAPMPDGARSARKIDPSELYDRAELGLTITTLLASVERWANFDPLMRNRLPKDRIRHLSSMCA